MEVKEAAKEEVKVAEAKEEVMEVKVEEKEEEEKVVVMVVAMVVEEMVVV